MSSLNKVQLIGYTGKKPEVKETKNGKKIVKFSLATSKKVNGEDQTAWHQVQVFGQAADFCANFVDKGYLVYCEGDIEYQSWEKDGETKYRTMINVFVVRSFMRKGESQFGADQEFPGDEPNTEDDIPF